MKNSINIKYDINDSNLVHHYYATSTHSEIIKGILSGIMNRNPMKAHIAYGPYGSGKSYITTILAGLLNKSLKSNEYNSLCEKFSDVDLNIKKLINESHKTSFKYIPVILNGYEGEFSSSLINAISKTLQKENIAINFPGVHNSIVKTIKRWKVDFPHTFHLFMQHLEAEKYEIDDYISLINKQDQEIITHFTKLHKKLTAGAELISFNDYNIIDFIQEITYQMVEKKLGLFIVHDEFGRVLQNLSYEKINIFMQIMQDLAELANNGVNNLTTLFIAHRPLGYYFSFASQDMRSEFAKVEKRFSTYEIKSDYYTFLQITEGFLSNNFIIEEKPNEKLIRDAQKYNVFKGILNDLELESKVINGLFPLHPVATYLLPKISSVFGQNERTLFSFLTDESENGFEGFFLRNKNQIYYPDRLVDYFLNGIDESYVENIKEYKIYNKNYNNISKIFKAKELSLAERIYKFILIWNISNSKNNIKLSTEFISYCLGEIENHSQKILSNLSDKKMVRYNNLHDQWEIFEGSPINLLKELKRRSLEENFTEKDFIKNLENLNPYRYLYPLEYNAKHEMTRFGTVQFTTEEYYDEFKPVEYTDYNILISLGLKIDELRQVDYIIQKPKESQKLRDSILRIKIINDLLKNTYFISEYPNVDIELEYEKDQIQKYLNEFYLGIIKSEYKTLHNMSKILSSEMERKYPSTLYIINDQINMFNLTSIQENALISVLDQILNNNSLNLKKIYSGTKPTDLTYFTIVEKMSNMNKNKKVIKDLDLKLSRFIDNNQNGKLIDLVDIAVNEPFGLRPRLAILIVFMLILDKWKDMLLFNNGNYIPNINAKDLVDSILEKSNISYVFSKFDNSRRSYLEGLYDIFGDESDLVKGKTLSVRLCSAMYNWYLSLPVITQQGEGLSISEKSFLDIVKKSRINPQEAIDDLLDTFNDLQMINIFKENSENHFTRFKESYIKQIFRSIGIKYPTEWVNNQEEIHKKTNKLVKVIFNNLDLLKEYSSEIENIEPTRWTLSSFKALKARVTQDFNKISNNQSYHVININGVNKYISDVDLSIKGQVTMENIIATIDATKRYYSDSELEVIVLQLVNKYIK